MARGNSSSALARNVGDADENSTELERMTRDAIYEHRRLASIADAAYSDWEKVNKVAHDNDEIIAESQYRYMQAMVAMRMQQDELNTMINRLGYVPKITV